MRFLGSIDAKLDAKGRAFLPAVFRKVLQGAGCESMVMDSLRSRLSRWDRGEQQLFRRFVAEVEPVALDGNGRFLIPKRCLAQAGIDADVRFIGMGDTIEIWAAGACQSSGDDGDLGEELQKLLNIGF